MDQPGKLLGLIGMGLCGAFWGYMAITMVRHGNTLAAVPVGGLCVGVIVILLCVNRGVIR